MAIYIIRNLISLESVQSFIKDALLNLPYCKLRRVTVSLRA